VGKHGVVEEKKPVFEVVNVVFNPSKAIVEETNGILT